MEERETVSPHQDSHVFISVTVFKTQRNRLQEEAETKIGFEDLGRRIGALWKQISPEEKKVYQDQASLEMDRYKREMAVYKAEQFKKSRQTKGASLSFPRGFDQQHPTDSQAKRFKPNPGRLASNGMISNNVVASQGLPGLGAGTQQLYPMGMAGTHIPVFFPQNIQLAQQLQLPFHQLPPNSLNPNAFPNTLADANAPNTNQTQMTTQFPNLPMGQQGGFNPQTMPFVSPAMRDHQMVPCPLPSGEQNLGSMSQGAGGGGGLQAPSPLDPMPHFNPMNNAPADQAMLNMNQLNLLNQLTANQQQIASQLSLLQDFSPTPFPPTESHLPQQSQTFSQFVPTASSESTVNNSIEIPSSAIGSAGQANNNVEVAALLDSLEPNPLPGPKKGDK